jgi:hypothetical protein
MKFVIKSPLHVFWPTVVALVTTVAGCGRDEIKVYRVPKETAQAEASAPPQPETASPRLTWTLPAGWTEKPNTSSIRAATFEVGGTNGRSAEVSVIPLPGIAGRELELVNMWREQAHLPSVGPQDLVKQTESISVGADQAKLFDIVSEEPLIDGKSRARILVAMLSKDGMDWFFKMNGEDALVHDQKPAFIQFVKSISFQPGVESARVAARARSFSANAKETPRENSDKPLWVVPPTWKEMPPTQMLLAKFVIAGSGNAKAEVNVSSLSGTGGGVLANVNRWRRQVGLSEATASDLDKLVTSLDVGSGKAMLVDMTGTDAKTGQKARLVGAIVPQSEQSWFYKLMGDEQIVEREKEVFTKFVQTVQYPNAP